VGTSGETPRDRALAFLLDASAREDSRGFVEAPALVVVHRAADLVVEYANAAGERVLDPRFVALVAEAIGARQRLVRAEVPLVGDWAGTGSTSEHLFNLVHEPIRADGQEVSSIVSFAYDVTDLVLARRRFEAAAREHEATSRAKDEFLANVSHELRTPLSSIMGWSALLRDHAHEPAIVRKAAEVILRSAKTQAKLVEDILDVSRIVTGKLRLDARPVSIESTVREAFEIVRPSASRKGILLSEDYDTDVVVIGDEHRLRQIVWNLLANAIKFTAPGGRVTGRTRRRASAVTIEIGDTGCGIAAEFLPRVFERFQQADTSTTRANGGLGLGLSIVRDLVELHGGSVSVASEGVGRGATFSVTLPLPAVVVGLGPVVRTKPPEAERAAPVSLEGLRVLVVDDETDAREVVAASLEAWGAAVVTAESAGRALEIASSETFDVVVSDVGMPDEDGYALAKRLRTCPLTSRVRSIALTSYARTSDAERALASGFDFHVTKPVDPEDLRDIVAHAAAARKATAPDT
jgi:signal transduction histidine kinase/ActR/RegA family two-component response regulator